MVPNMEEANITGELRATTMTTEIKKYKEATSLMSKSTFTGK